MEVYKQGCDIEFAFVKEHSVEKEEQLKTTAAMRTGWLWLADKLAVKLMRHHELWDISECVLKESWWKQQLSWEWISVDGIWRRNQKEQRGTGTESLKTRPHKSRALFNQVSSQCPSGYSATGRRAPFHDVILLVLASFCSKSSKALGFGLLRIYYESFLWDWEEGNECY